MFDWLRSGVFVAIGNAILAAILMFLGLGCTAGNTVPTVGYVERVIDEGITRQDEMVKTLSAQHAAMAPEIAPEIQAMVSVLSAFMDSQREINSTIAKDRVATANSTLDTLFGPAVTAGGMGGLFALVTGRKKESERVEEKNKLAALGNSLNGLINTLALNTPAPATPAVPMAPKPA